MLIVFIGLAIGAFLGLAILLALGIEHEFEIEAGVEAEIEGDFVAEAGPGILSVRLLLFFVLGFGIFGIIAMKVLNLTGLLAILVALVGAFLCYFVAYTILKLLWKQQVSTQFSMESLVGCEAIVTQKISAGGVGEIKAKCPNTGLEKYVSAKVMDAKQSIEKGEIVTVKSIVASTCMVEKKQGKN